MHHDFDVTLDEIVKDLREKAGMTQAQLATASGVSAPLIGHIEAGTRSVGVENLGRLADALGASNADRRRMARARDRASERLSTKKARRPTDLGPRPVSVLNDNGGQGRGAPALADTPDSEVESLRQEVEGLAGTVERLTVELDVLSKTTESNRKRLVALERQSRQSRRAGG